jgi:streptomycin 6-kinase
MGDLLLPSNLVDAAVGARLPRDPGLVHEGVELFRSLPAETRDDCVLCTDLHAENVLAARREPWLVIDPKPHVGDRAYDVLQHMLNCPRRLRCDPSAFTARMASLADLDAERVRLWLFARCVIESAHWSNLAEVARLIAPN